jgi:selenide,water dikinase
MPYSGMLPGLVAGHYAFEACHIDLERLCERADVRFRRASAVGIDPLCKTVMLDDGATQSYALLSIDIGSTPPIADVPGALQHAIQVRPVAAFLPAWDELRSAALQSRRATSIGIVGGGAGGVELALSLHFRLAHECPAAPPRVHLFTDTAEIVQGHAARVGTILGRILAERGIAVHTHSRVVRIEPGALYTESGTRHGADYVIWVTGAAAPPWVAASGIRTDDRGFITVNAFLQSVSHPDIFAAGDIAGMVGHRLPKSGVYAVRQGPPLTANLRRVLDSRPLIGFVPRRMALALISTGDKHAVASYGNAALEGRWVWRWKDRIDRRFMSRYRASR